MAADPVRGPRFPGAFLGHYGGLTGVAAGVLAALFVNFLLMAQLGVSVGQISWLRFAEAQFPAIRLTLLLGVVTIAVAAGTRHLGLPPIATFLIGLAVAAEPPEPPHGGLRHFAWGSMARACAMRFAPKC